MSPRIYQPARLPNGERNPRHRTRPTGSRGKAKNHFVFGQFCAWDGEGLTVDGEHRYVLLANSERDARWNIEGLSTFDVLGIICARARALDRRTTHVIFGGSYDVNCWLKDVNLSTLRKIWSGAPVYLGDNAYRVQYRPRRSFVIWELQTGTRVTIWDVWGFFQGTFVGALEKYGLAVPERLRAMKKARAKFRANDRAKITEYCHEECALLVQLMQLVREHLDTAKLPIRRWDGAGACAAALLARERTRPHQAQSPPAVRRAAQHAYAGGRIEMARYGHAPKVPLHHYDINSAYPAACRDLPSFDGGRWVRGATMDPTERFTIFRVAFDFHESISRAYPFFWRAPNGSIFYPSCGEGWYWRPEVDAARAALQNGDVSGRLDILDSWSWIPASDVKPFAFIDDLFVQRAAWKRDGIGAEKMLKLALNSLYGKCAQHVGGKDGEAPRYHCLEWAGWITSVTRAALYRAACEAGPGLVMLATDGIFSTELLPSLRVGKSLGEWEYHCHAGATVVQSGVYWLDDCNEDGTRTTSDFSRGFDRGSLVRTKIVRAWKFRQLTWNAELTRFVTMGAVANGHAKEKDWRQWKTTPRVLALTPSGTKRADVVSPNNWTAHAGRHPAYGYIPTAPTMPAALIVGSKCSSLYPLPWVGDEPLIEDADTIKMRFIEWEAMEE